MAENTNTNNNRNQRPQGDRNNQRGGFQRGGNNQRGRFNNRDRRPRREEEIVEKVWVPKTQLGKDVLSGKFTSIKDVI